MTNDQTNTKCQLGNDQHGKSTVLVILIWLLVLVWTLVIGAWSFYLRVPKARLLPAAGVV
jgi:hypothetical protein